MSRSWTDYLKSWWPGHEPLVAVAFQADRIDAVRLEDDGAISHTWSTGLSPTLFDNPVDNNAREALTGTLAPLAGWAGRDYVRVLVSVPDAVADAVVFPFDRLPRGRGAREQLLRWRLGQVRGPNNDSSVLRSQALGRDAAGRYRLWTCAVDRAWRDAATGALTAVGLVPTTLDIEVRFQFNWLHRRGYVGDTPGMLLNVSPGHFGIIVWDDAARPRWFRARWRNAILRQGLQSGTERLIAELKRLLLAYPASPDSVPLSRACLAAPTGESDVLVDILSRELGIEFTVFDELLHAPDPAASADIHPMAMAVTLGR